MGCINPGIYAIIDEAFRESIDNEAAGEINMVEQRLRQEQPLGLYWLRGTSVKKTGPLRTIVSACLHENMVRMFWGRQGTRLWEKITSQGVQRLKGVLEIAFAWLVWLTFNDEGLSGTNKAFVYPAVNRLIGLIMLFRYTLIYTNRISVSNIYLHPKKETIERAKYELMFQGEFA